MYSAIEAKRRMTIGRPSIRLVRAISSKMPPNGSVPNTPITNGERSSANEFGRPLDVAAELVEIGGLDGVFAVDFGTFVGLGLQPRRAACDRHCPRQGG